MGQNFSNKEFRECLSHYSTGITIVSTRDKTGKMDALTVNSFTSVSINPPLVLFCIDNNAKCLEAFLNNDSFAVTILASSQHHIAEKFSNDSESDWEGINYIFGVTSSPIIVPHLSFLECEKFTYYKAGDHHIVIGKVIALDIIKGEKKNPLIYFRGEYHHSPQVI